jgi:hypothetical protein
MTEGTPGVYLRGAVLLREEAVVVGEKEGADQKEVLLV